MEHNSLLTTIWYIALGIGTGIIHAINAREKLEKKFRIYIFFQPFKTFIFWVWLSIQILIPAVIYWWIFIKTCPEKPNIDCYFILKVIIYGISFSSLLTNIETQALIPVNVSIIVNRVDRLLEKFLQKKQLTKTANFWDSLEKEMKQLEDLSPGIKYLKDYYFYVKYNSINKEKYQYFKNKLEKIAQNKNVEELIAICLKEIIPRQDLPEVLQQFHLSETFINQYFPQS
ncbi:MAG: hypothetical protein QNJ64_02605 [Crocosphaera sp.]|nr:hypothetical protein [Crocosphaera sp.]